MNLKKPQHAPIPQKNHPHLHPIPCCGRFEKRPYRQSPLPPSKNLHIPIILINFAIPDCTNQPPMLVMGGFVRKFLRAIWDVVTTGRDRASGHRIHK